MVFLMPYEFFELEIPQEFTKCAKELMNCSYSYVSIGDLVKDDKLDLLIDPFRKFACCKFYL
jgi:hypothetical protein